MEHKFRHSLLAAAAISTLAFGTPALAQSGGYIDQPSPNEDVVITAPRAQERSDLGAPVRDVAIQRAVSFHDLNLRTRSGANELRHRVRATAHELCRELDTRYPTTAEGSPPCYTTALKDAMYQADMAIADARYD